MVPSDTSTPQANRRVSDSNSGMTTDPGYSSFLNFVLSPFFRRSDVSTASDVSTDTFETTFDDSLTQPAVATPGELTSVQVASSATVATSPVAGTPAPTAVVAPASSAPLATSPVAAASAPSAVAAKVFVPPTHVSAADSSVPPLCFGTAGATESSVGVEEPVDHSVAYVGGSVTSESPFDTLDDEITPGPRRVYKDAASFRAARINEEIKLVTQAFEDSDEKLLRALLNAEYLSDPAHQLCCTYLGIRSPRPGVCRPSEPCSCSSTSCASSSVSPFSSVLPDDEEEEESIQSEEEEEESLQSEDCAKSFIKVERTENFMFDVNSDEVAAAQAKEEEATDFSPSSYLMKVSKYDRLARGSDGYADQREEMTKGPKQSGRLGAANWAVVGTSSSGDRSKETELMAHLESDNEKLLSFQDHMNKYDFNQSQVPVPRGHITRVSSTNVHPSEFFDTQAKPINLSDSWGGTAIDIPRFVQRFINTSPYVAPVDKENSRLMGLYLMNCMTATLQKAVKENMDKFFTPQERGGITVLYCMMKTAYALQASNMDALRAEIEKFAEDGLTKVPGHNVASVELKLSLVVNQLAVINGLDVKHVGMVLKGLTKCPNSDFEVMFREMRLEHLKGEITFDVDTPVTYATSDQQGIATQILDILKAAKVLYMRMSKAGEWEAETGSQFSYSANSLVPSGSRTSGISCHNCKKNHHLDQCPLPHNQAEIKKNRKEFFAERDARRAAGGTGSGGTGSDRSGSGGGTGATIPRRDTAGNTPQFRMNESSGLIEFKCLKCKRLKGKAMWTNHTSKEHAKAMKNSNFCYWKENPNCPAGRMARQCAAKVEKESSATAANATSVDADKQKALWEKVNTLGTDSVEGKAAFNALRAAAARDFQ